MLSGSVMFLETLNCIPTARVSERMDQMDQMFLAEAWRHSGTIGTIDIVMLRTV